MPIFVKRFAVVLSLSLLTAPAFAAAAAPRWAPIGPWGGSVRTLLIDPVHTKVLYAVGDFPSVIKSTDGGAHWAVLPDSQLAVSGAGNITGVGGVVGVALALDPTQPTTLYAGSPGQLAKSVDGGVHWTSIAGALHSFLLPRALAVDPVRPDRVYLGSEAGGVWRSDNGGRTWQSTAQGLPGGQSSSITALAVARRPGTVFAGTEANGVFKSVDGGASWTPANHGLPGGAVQALTLAPSDPRTLYVSLLYGIFRSTDGGASWTPAGAPGPAEAPITGLAVDPRDPLTTYAGGRTGLFKTTDGGAHWDPLGNFPESEVGALAIDPTRSGTVYAGAIATGTDTGGVLRSADGGETWQSRSLGIPGLDTLAVAGDPRSPGLLAAGTNGAGLFVRRPGTTLWERSPLGFTPAPALEPGVIVPQLLFSPRGAAEALYATVSPYTLARSTDGGLSFSAIPSPPYPTAIHALRQEPAAPFRLVWLAAYGSSSALWSSLPGRRWNPLNDPCVGCGYHDLAVVRPPGSTLPTLYLAGGDTQVGAGDPQPPIFLRSDDGGATWLDLAAGLPVGRGVQTVAVDPRDPRTVYAGLTADRFGRIARIWKSTDGGATWSPTGENPGIYLTVVALLASPRPGRVYAAVADGRVFRSDDGGGEWSLWNAGLAVRTVHALALDPNDPLHVYAATSGGVWEADDAN
jgi:photosystem II stability/assembly factor-like uncharacterized protein